MEYQDKRLRCLECGTEFLWSAGEQGFFAGRNFRHEPRRCRPCKAGRKRLGPGATAVESRATCSACGRATTVPFQPSQGRPVFCRTCYQQRPHLGA
jgi:CxxC-x17-CxxC domain-containing protein